MKLRLLITLCWIFASGCLCAPAFGAQKDEGTSQTHHLNYYQLLHEWLQLSKIYAAQDDSINLVLPQDQWIGVISRRTTLHRQINERTTQILQSIEEEIENHRQENIDMFRDSLTYETCIFDSAYFCHNAHIIASLFAHNLQYTDPFLADYLLSLVTPDMERYMPHSELVLLNYCSLAISNFQLCLQDNYRTSQRCVEYSRKAYAFAENFENLSSPEVQRGLLSVSRFLFEPLLVHRDALTMETAKKEWTRVSDFFEKHELYCNNAALADTYKSVDEDILWFPTRLLRNCIMTNEWNYHDQFSDEAAMVLLAHDEKLFSTVTDNDMDKYEEYHNYKVFQVYMGQITFDEACIAMDTYYDKVAVDSALLRKNPAIITNAISDQIFVCDMSSLPHKEKHKRILAYCQNLVRLLKYVACYAPAVRVSGYVNTYLNNVRIYKYLTQEERIQFFNSICAFTQVHTFVHSVVVGQLCGAILEEVIDSQPELLVGVHGINAASDLKKKAVKHELLSFMHNASLYYDIGKNTMMNVVNNYFRPLVPKERELLTLHPARGSQILKATSKLTAYEDFVLGHHKWYNGKKGYPAWYDNTLTDNRLLVDILTIADCMEAAISHPIRRSYRPTYTFDGYLEEMKKRSFTQFNPNVLSLIQKSPELRKALHRILEEDRYNTYYSLHKKYFEHSDKK